MRALVDKLNPDDRMRFFDELPEEAWQLVEALYLDPSGLGFIGALTSTR